MANYNEHKCFTCGQIFEYCRRCVITPVVYKAEGFCSEKCSDIFNTLSKHGCNLISADEVLEALSTYNLDEITLTEDILAHIEEVNSEVGEKIEKTVTTVETPAVEQSDKNKKKKW